MYKVQVGNGRCSVLEWNLDKISELKPDCRQF